MQEGEGRCPPPSPSLSATQEAFQDRTVALAYGSHTLRQLDPRLQAANCPGNQSQTLDCCRRHVVSVPPNPCQSQDTKGQWPKHNRLTSLCTKKLLGTPAAIWPTAHHQKHQLCRSFTWEAHLFCRVTRLRSARCFWGMHAHKKPTNSFTSFTSSWQLVIGQLVIVAWMVSSATPPSLPLRLFNPISL